MEIEMTWTVLYVDSDNKILHKPVFAPHGKKDAWAYIQDEFNLNIIAIIPGSHNVYSDAKLNTDEEHSLSIKLL